VKDIVNRKAIEAHFSNIAMLYDVCHFLEKRYVDRVIFER